MHLVAAFRKGLAEAGFVEGKDVAIELRFADDDFGRLPALATDLVRRGVAVIVGNNFTLPAIRAATTYPGRLCRRRRSGPDWPRHKPQQTRR
jgi:hypothetical protein